ncbi:hypothetical protein FHX08_005336 [Rhizobium sp. BK529]|nr:hypothetical protein [Rhizobium sp. BK529]
MVNNGYDGDLAITAVETGRSTRRLRQALHRPSDLVERLQKNLPLNAGDQATFSGGGAKRYADYPLIDKAA